MRACQPFVTKNCGFCNESREDGFNSNARIVQELPRAMCGTT